MGKLPPVLPFGKKCTCERAFDGMNSAGVFFSVYDPRGPGGQPANADVRTLSCPYKYCSLGPGSSYSSIQRYTAVCATQQLFMWYFVGKQKCIPTSYLYSGSLKTVRRKPTRQAMNWCVATRAACCDPNVNQRCCSAHSLLQFVVNLMNVETCNLENYACARWIDMLCVRAL